MPFEIERAQKTVADIGRLTSDLAAADEKRRELKAELRKAKASLKQLLAAPRKAKTQPVPVAVAGGKR